MALNDWKKVSKNPKFTQWFNEKTRVSVFVFFQDYIPELKKKSHWTMEVNNREGVLYSEDVATRQIAENKAKQFMNKY